MIRLDLDGTLFHGTGRRIVGSGSFRDAVRSARRRVVYAHGLDLVVLSLRVVGSWGGEPLGLPVKMRLCRKGGCAHVELAEQMLVEAAGWLPARTFRLGCDGAYAGLAGRCLRCTHVVSRTRRDAAVYSPPPPRAGRRAPAAQERRPAARPDPDRRPGQGRLEACHRRRARRNRAAAGAVPASAVACRLPRPVRPAGDRA